MNAWTRRRSLLAGALAAAVALSAVTATQRDTVAEVVQPTRSGATATQAAAVDRTAIALETLQPRRPSANDSPAAHDSFGATTWRVAPPPAPKPVAKAAPPPAPTAPPAPFTFLGRYEDGNTRVLMLVRDDRIYTVSAGDVIDQTWRVEGLSGGQLTLTYVPLNIQRTINAGGS